MDRTRLRWEVGADGLKRRREAKAEEVNRINRRHVCYK